MTAVVAPSRPFRDPLRKPAIACGAMIALAIGIAAYGTTEHRRPVYADVPVAASMQLKFIDADDGTVIARDVATGRDVGRFGFGEGGFVRTTVRGLALERKRRGLDDSVPFTLSRLDNGRLVLTDPAIDRTILLDAFGSDNAGAFAALMRGPEQDPGRTS